MGQINRYSKNNKKIQRNLRWSRRSRMNKGIPKESKNGTAGYVYIFDLGHDNLYKVGMSGDWQSRLKELRSASPDMRMVMAVRVKDARKCESHLHRSFKKFHYSRELYRLSNDHLFYAEKYLNANSNSVVEEIEIPIEQKISPPKISGWLSRRKEDIPGHTSKS